MGDISSAQLQSSSEQRQPIFPVANPTEPYWRIEKHPIDDYRSTEDLPAECDIAIIGAGMSGVTTAYHLLENQAEEQRPSIVILEARQVCSGATGRNGGHIKVQVATIASYIESYGYEMAIQVVEFCLQHITALKKIVEREELDCEFELRRSFDVWLDEEEAKNILQFWQECLVDGQEWMKDYGLIDARYVEQVTSMKGAKLAFSTPACSLWPYKFVTQLLARLIDRNAVNLQTNTRVENVSIDKTADVNIISTARGTIRAGKVIFATNGYTAGLVSAYEDRIVPYRGTATHITPASPVSPHLLNTYNINYPPGGRRDYMNPRPDGGIVIGGGKWTYGDDSSHWFNVWDDSILLDEVRPHFDGLMQRHFYGWENSGAHSDQIWTGIMATTADGMPHIGMIPDTNGRQYILAGYNGGGMPLILLCARSLASMVRDGTDFESTSLPAIFKTTKERLANVVQPPKAK